jgi:hypothetical protein
VTVVTNHYYTLVANRFTIDSLAVEQKAKFLALAMKVALIKDPSPTAENS